MIARLFLWAGLGLAAWATLPATGPTLHAQRATPPERARAPMVFADVHRLIDDFQQPELALDVGIELLTLELKAEDRHFLADVTVWRRIRQGATLLLDDSVRLTTPPLPDTSIRTLNQQLTLPWRQAANWGATYTVEVRVADNLAPNRDTAVLRRRVTFPPQDPQAVTLGDVMLLASIRPAQPGALYQRHGQTLRPLTTGGYLVHPDSVGYLAEWLLPPALNQQPVRVQACLHLGNRPEPIPGRCQDYKPAPGTPRQAVLGWMPLATLPTQTYRLRVAVLDEAGNALAAAERKLYVDSYMAGQTAQGGNGNPSGEPQEGDYVLPDLGLTAEQAAEYLPSLTYIASREEQDLLDGLTTDEEKLRFMQRFWQRRGETREGPTPMEAWQAYKKRVDYANQNYAATHLPGWATERGRVLIQYGPPTNRQTYPYQQELYPYEIWTYNELNSQMNVIFVFYDDDLATETWPLLHSTLVGEIFNAAWRQQLNKANNLNISNYLYERPDPGNDPMSFPDDQTMPPTIGTPR